MTETNYAVRAGDLLALVKTAKQIIDNTDFENSTTFTKFQAEAWLEVVQSRDYIMESIKNG